MNPELGPDARALLEASRDAHDPTAADKARVKKLLAASIAALPAGTAEAATSGSSGGGAFGLSGAVKVGLAVTALSVAAAVGVRWSTPAPQLVEAGDVRGDDTRGRAVADRDRDVADLGRGDTADRVGAKLRGEAAERDRRDADRIAPTAAGQDDEATSSRRTDDASRTAADRGAHAERAAVASNRAVEGSGDRTGDRERSGAAFERAVDPSGDRERAGASDRAMARGDGRTATADAAARIDGAGSTATERTAADEEADDAAPGAKSGVEGADRTLAAQAALLGEVRVALRDEAHAKVLDLVTSYEAQYPSGVLREEALAARVLALCGLDRSDDAQAARDALVRLSPSSPHLARIDDACGQQGVR